MVHTDHRRVDELMRRLGRQYRAGESLRVQATGEIRAHVDATRDVLLPFAEDRGILAADALESHRRLLDDLLWLVEPVESSSDPVPAPLAETLAAGWRRHVDAEEPVLAELGVGIDVSRLRVLGAALRRRRDSALREALRGTSHLRRPVPTRAELYEKARRLQIEGRSGMSRAELQAALEHHDPR